VVVGTELIYDENMVFHSGFQSWEKFVRDVIFVLRYVFYRCKLVTCFLIPLCGILHTAKELL